MLSGINLVIILGCRIVMIYMQLTMYITIPGMGKLGPGGPISLQSLAPTLIDLTYL